MYGSTINWKHLGHKSHMRKSQSMFMLFGEVVVFHPGFPQVIGRTRNASPRRPPPRHAPAEIQFAEVALDV